MANALFSFDPFDFNGIQSGYSHNEDYEKEELVIKRKQDRMFSMEDLGQVYPICSENGAHQDSTENKELNFFRDQQQQQPQQQQSPPKSNYLPLDDLFGYCFPAPAQPTQEIRKLENIFEQSKEMQYTPALSSSLQLLHSYGSGITKLNANLPGSASDETCFGSRKKLSTEEIIRVAGSMFIQFSDQRYDDSSSMLMHPFGYALSGLSEEEKRDVELAHLLLAAAEKVGYQQFDRASRLLSRGERVASERSDPIHCRGLFTTSQKLFDGGLIRPEEDSLQQKRRENQNVQLLVVL